MVSITHKYVSANGDPPDSSLIGQTKWNDDHNVVGLTPGVDIQPYSANLDSWSLVAPGSYLTVAAAAASYQPLASALTSWASVSRASGFDTFAATPSSANLRSLLTDETGTGAAVFANTPTLVSPVLGTPTSGNLANCTSYPLAQLSGSGTGVLTALGVNVGSAGAFVIFNGALGTPSSGTLTNCTGLPISGIASLGTGIGTWLSTPSSANLASAITDETGSGSLVFASAPTLTNPVVGTQSALDNSTKAASTAYVDRTTREILTANRTYYVRTDGSNSNTGLANTSGGAFLTIQKAIDTVGSLDLSIYNVTIQVGAGTYTQNLVLKSLVGAGRVTILGDTTTPSNVNISPATGPCFTADSITGLWSITGFKTTSTGGAIQFLVTNAALTIGVIDYGDAGGGGIHLYAGSGGKLFLGSSNCIISASSFGYHIFLDNNSVLYGGTRSTTITGNPTFTTFAHCTGGANLRNGAETFSGSVTAGKKYNAILNGTIESNATTFPGPTAGTTATGGQFV